MSNSVEMDDLLVQIGAEVVRVIGLSDRMGISPRSLLKYCPEKDDTVLGSAIVLDLIASIAGDKTHRPGARDRLKGIGLSFQQALMEAQNG